MAMDVKVLAFESLSQTNPNRTLYKAPTSPTNRSTVVKSMRFVNVTSPSAVVTLDLRFLKSGDASGAANERYIFPSGLKLPGGNLLEDSVELTLSPGDSILATAAVTGSPAGDYIDFSIFGLERDV